MVRFWSVVTALSSIESVRAIHRELRNWYTAGVTGVLVEPSRHWKGLLHTSYARRPLCVWTTD